MAVTAGTLNVKVVPDVSRFGSDLNRSVSGSVGTAGASAGQTFGSRFSGGLMPTIAKIGAGIGAALLVKGAFNFVKEGVAAFGELNAVSAQTDAIIKATGGAAGVTSESFRAMAEELAGIAGQDDVVVQKGMNVLATFKNIRNEAGAGNAIFDQASMAMLDLADVFGSVDSASIQLGKALNDPVKGMTALSKAGVSFEPAQQKMIKSMVASGDVLGAQKIILAEIEGQVGGTAAAYGKTLPGQLTIAKEAFEDLKIGLAAGLAPALASLAPAVSALVPAFQPLMEALGQTLGSAIQSIVPLIGSLASAFAPLLPVIGRIVASLAGALAPVFAALAPAIGELVDMLGNALLNVIAGLAPALPPIAEALAQILIALAPLLPSLSQLIVAFTPLIVLAAQLSAILAGGVAQALRIVVGALRPIINVVSIVIRAITDFIANLVGAATTSKAMGAVITGAWNTIKSVTSSVWNAIKSIITGVFNALKSAVSAYFNGYKTVILAVWNAIKSLSSSVWNGIKGTVTGVWDALKSAASTVWKAIQSAISTPVLAVTKTVTDTFNKLKTTITGIWDSIKSGAKTAWDTVVGVFKGAVDAMISASERLAAIICKLPFVPCSPIPMVVGAKASAKAIKGLTRTMDVAGRTSFALPSVAGVDIARGGLAAAGQTVNNYYNLNVAEHRSTGYPTSDFRLLEAMAS